MSGKIFEQNIIYIGGRLSTQEVLTVSLDPHELYPLLASCLVLGPVDDLAQVLVISADVLKKEKIPAGTDEKKIYIYNQIMRNIALNSNPNAIIRLVDEIEIEED